MHCSFKQFLFLLEYIQIVDARLVSKDAYTRPQLPAGRVAGSYRQLIACDSLQRRAKLLGTPNTLATLSNCWSSRSTLDLVAQICRQNLHKMPFDRICENEPSNVACNSQQRIAESCRRVWSRHCR